MISNKMKCGLSTLVLLWSTGSWAQAAASTNDSADATGEIVVTATRQAQTLNKVPVSVSAYTRATMDAQGIRNVADITRLTPGLYFEPTRNRTNISIRGISSTAGAPTTGIYIDDTPISSRAVGYGGGNTYPMVFDLERVEVLRGPQGTLFGAGSQGGTVRFITTRPSLSKTNAYARSELSFTSHGDPSYELGASGGAPLVEDKLGIQLSAWYRRDGGYVDRKSYPSLATVDNNSNWANNYMARAAIAWAADEHLTITPSLYLQKTYQNDSSFIWPAFSDPGRGDFTNINPGKDLSRDKFLLPSVNATYDAGSFDIVAVGSYFDRKSLFDVDYTSFAQSIFTGNPFPTLPNQKSTSRFSFNQKTYTGEVRLQSSDADAPLRWVVGAFWMQAKQFSKQSVDDAFFPTYIQNAFGAPYTNFFVPILPGNVISENIFSTTDKQIAAFGQIDYRIVDRLTMTVGLRASRNSFDIDATISGPANGPTVRDTGSQKESPITPKFSLNFQATPDHLFYVSAAKGFRPGGYNPAVGVTCAGQLGALGLSDRPLQFDSDAVWSYEAGAKSRLFERRLQIDASVYRIDWSNIQQVVNLNSCGYAFNANLGSARSTGFDLQLRANITDRWTVSTAIGYTSAKFRETLFAGPSATLPVVSKGDRVEARPWTVLLSGEYTLPLADDRSAYFRADYTYNSHQDAVLQRNNPANGGDALLPAPPAMHNMQVRAGLRLSAFDVSLFVNNLFDAAPWTTQSRYPRSMVFNQSTVRPRTMGLTGTVRY